MVTTFLCELTTTRDVVWQVAPSISARTVSEHYRCLSLVTHHIDPNFAGDVVQVLMPSKARSILAVSRLDARAHAQSTLTQVSGHLTRLSENHAHVALGFVPLS